MSARQRAACDQPKADDRFDMDFRTTCEIKAKATGMVTIMKESVFRDMKPSYKALEDR